MGLSTTHDCWHGPYSAFTHWRNMLAVTAGYQLMHPTPEEIADGAIPSHRYAMIEWTGISQENFAGEWTRTPPDPLIVLLAHSDCDGVIHPEQGGPLAGRLEGLLPLVPDYPYPLNAPIPDYWRDQTRAFIDGLREAWRLGEDVGFN